MNKSKYFLILLFIISFSEISYSLPRFALRMGGQCADCHINPTGGELRNKGGYHFEQNVLPMFSAHKDFKMDDKIGENIYYGLDYRMQYLYSQGAKKTDFQKMSGSFYTDVKIDDKIDLYGSYDLVNQFWEAYGIGHFLPNGGYIKAGTYSPNYGVRVDDHTAYTRGGDLGFITNSAMGLIYQPGYTETGVELGEYFSDFIFFTASVGNPHYSFAPTDPAIFREDPSYTASLQITPVIANKIPILVGGSYSTFKGTFGPLIPKTYPKVNMYGGFLGFGVGNFTLIGEYDIAQNLTADKVNANALMVKANYLVVKGLEAVVRYDRFDPNKDVTNDELSRWILGLEFFPYSFIELRPQYRIQMENPSIDNNSFVLQFHLYY
jgi:hypothetical protein